MCVFVSVCRLNKLLQCDSRGERRGRGQEHCCRILAVLPACIPYHGPSERRERRERTHEFVVDMCKSLLGVCVCVCVCVCACVRAGLYGVCVCACVCFVCVCR